MITSTLVRRTLRLSCGARTQPRFRRRPPARRQLQPVVRRTPEDFRERVCPLVHVRVFNALLCAAACVNIIIDLTVAIPVLSANCARESKPETTVLHKTAHF